MGITLKLMSIHESEDYKSHMTGSVILSKMTHFSWQVIQILCTYSAKTTAHSGFKFSLWSTRVLLLLGVIALSFGAVKMYLLCIG